MTSGLPALRALVIYGICLPLALMIGYLLANNWDWSTIAFFGLFTLILCAPLLLKWHHPLAVVALNLTAVAFFIPGSPQLWMLFAGLSFCVSILQLTLSRHMSFISVPSVTAPLVFLLLVVIFTARFTGGIGFHAFGGSSIGGKHYVTVFAAILAYFAVTARRIPPHKGFLYTGLFFLGGATAVLSSLVYFVPTGFNFIFYLFPPEALPGESLNNASADIPRLGGLAVGCVAAIYLLLSRYGLRGILFAGKPWRVCALGACTILSMFGGFRSLLIMIMLVVAFMAWLEGLYNSRYMPLLVLGGVLLVALTLPFTTKLPLTLQRTLAFLPVQVDPVAQEAARDSSEWRIQIWKDVLPEIPQYFWLGKGYAINLEEWSQANASSSLQNQGNMIVSGDYHSGPLSTVIPFGIWGVIGLLWLLWAGGRLLYFNYRYGDPEFSTINTLLLAAFLTEVVLFVFVFGSLYSDLIKFTSLLGLSVTLNGGKCRPAPAPARQPVNIKFRMPLRTAPGFSRSSARP